MRASSMHSLTNLAVRAVSPQFRSVNFTWLKLLALALMFFDHASVCYLREIHAPEGSSLLRLPGRICIPAFAFLIAYGYTYFSHDHIRYALRLIALALIAEPCYWLCFHDLGNAFIPLALASCLFVALDRDRSEFERYAGCVVIGVLAIALAYITRSVDVVLVLLMCVSFRCFLQGRVVSLLEAFALAFFCNWPSVGTAIALLLSFALILSTIYYDLHLPHLRLHKMIAYLFYPGHLLLLFAFSIFGWSVTIR